jgi:hypothetical protein
MINDVLICSYNYEAPERGGIDESYIVKTVKMVKGEDVTM